MEVSALQDVKTGEWLPGTIVGDKYVLIERIGEDSIATLYRAETVDGHEPRLIRALRVELADDPVIARDFSEIYELVGRVIHPSLPSVKATGRTAGRPFIVTTAAEGRTLHELLGDEGRFDPARACAIARQIAAGLEAAHRLGMLHLGLDPRQIIIGGSAGEERVIVQELGAAHVRMSRVRRFMSGASSSDVRLSIHDLLPAAPAYCAPETALARSTETLDGRADLYSLGVITYRLLMGRLPASVAPAAADGLSMLVAQMDSSPLEFDSSIPEPLARLVRQLLETRRELRPATARMVTEWFGRAAVAAAPTRPVRVPALTREKQPAASAEPIPLPVSVPQVAPGHSLVEALPVAAAAIPEPAADSPAPEPPSIPPATPPVEPSLKPVEVALLAGQAAPESDSKAAYVFAELPLEAPSVPEPAAPIVLRPGGRVISQTTPEQGQLAVSANAEVLSAGPATSGPAMERSADLPLPAKLGSPTSVLFKTEPVPQPSVGWGRRILAGAVVALVLAVAIFFVRESKKLKWDSLTPTTVDQEHSLSRPDANAEVTPSTSPSKSPSNTAPASTPATAPKQIQPASPAPLVSGSHGATAAGQNPATGGSPGSIIRPPASNTPAPISEAGATEVRRAVAAGDVFYQTGQYDLAIQTYEGPLKDHPKNQLLRSRIERARKAKSAEQEYLGQ